MEGEADFISLGQGQLVKPGMRQRQPSVLRSFEGRTNKPSVDSDKFLEFLYTEQTKWPRLEVALPCRPFSEHRNSL